MLAILFSVAAVAFVVGYFTYGRYLSSLFGLDNTRKTPSEEQFDGVDYCPAHPAVLVGHHFASIAGAGPIVGPIAGASLFGWLPVYLWCVLGSIFLGGPHDMGAVAASIRHQGKSVGEVVRRWIGPRGKTLFLCFTWLSLVLVVAVFLQLSADTFAADPVVAFSGTVYIILALIFGTLVYRFHLPLLWGSVIAIPLVLGAVVYGHSAGWVQTVFNLDMETWRWILVGYIFVASVLPVWLLLQPRDYLASYLLYFAVIVGCVGMLFGGRFEIALPAYKGFVPKESSYLWPLLFVTVACGAVSGFHSMVASGTTSKQLKKETDARFVGYGSMLAEGLVAVIALGTLMVVGKIPEQGGPMAAFGEGFGKFSALLGMDPSLGKSLGLLAVNSFILTSLDTGTRLSRYQLQELSNMKLDRYTATAIGVAGAVALVLFKSGELPAWKIIWPVFGSANQLVAALVFLAMAVWVVRGLKKRATALVLPMVFMLVTALAALILLIQANWGASLTEIAVVAVSVVLFGLALLLVAEAIKAVRRRDTAA